ncbi:YegS/Rv2252/BmrU family lipid kinase [bacterium]|nr:YegS/Rv2252/BmrU family lipid kinase [bacterium]
MKETFAPKRVRVLFNPKSGSSTQIGNVWRAIRDTWDTDGLDLGYYESKSPEDGKRKVGSALRDGVDTFIVVGGDGMVNSIGSALIDTDAALAVIPTGSGNGFARHFGIPLRPAEASKVLRQGQRQRIDVGFANGKPFFVTCGLAWDADLVKGFEASPVRGIMPYVFAGIQHLFTYEPQHFTLDMDGRTVELEKPLVLTVANLTQYGGGAKIAPDAQPDDGTLTMVAALQKDAFALALQVHRLFDGTLQKSPEIKSWTFQKCLVKRERDDQIDLDGELVEAGAKDVNIEVKPASLSVIIPAAPEPQRESWSVE